MEIKKVLIFTFMSFLLLVGISSASEISLSIKPKLLTVYAGETGSVEVNVKNNQAFKDIFSISLFPLQYYPSLEKYSLTLNPQENMSFKIHFQIPECAEEASNFFTLTVVSLTNTEIKTSESFRIDVVRKYGVCIYDFKLDKNNLVPGEKLSIQVLVKNPSPSFSQPFTIQTNIWFDKELVKKFEEYVESVEGKGTKILTHVFELSKYQKPGIYDVEVLLKDKYGTTITRKEAQFKVLTINASERLNYLPITKTIRYGLLAQTIEITIKNEGNVPATNIYLSESIPLFMKVFFFPKKEPSKEEVKENRVIYSWQVPTLMPGESYSIVYEISTWNAVLIAIILILIASYTFVQAFNIKIVKKPAYKGPITKEKEITVMLEVKNRSRHEIKDVIVRDFAPGIVKVVEKFDTLRPSLRKVANGTELVWKIDSLAPGDERVLIYRIKPIVDIVGSLKLPKAYLKFMDKKKEVKKILSKSAYIKAG